MPQICVLYSLNYSLSEVLLGGRWKSYLISIAPLKKIFFWPCPNAYWIVASQPETEAALSALGSPHYFIQSEFLGHQSLDEGKMSQLLVLLHLCHVICLLFGKIVKYTNTEHRLHTITGESESEVAQSCPTLCDPMACRLPGSSLHGILQARVLEWVAISFSRGSSRPRGRTLDSRIPGRRFNLWATREAVTITGNYMQKISQTPKPNPSILTFCSFLDPCPSIS